MGCWNGTCGITNLPIKLGEKVYALLLANNGATTNVTYYADDCALIYGFPFKGEYDDYGCLENIEIKDYIWNFIKKQKYISIDNKGNENEFIPEDMEQMLQEIETLYVVSKQRELVENENGYDFQLVEKKSSLSFMLIHEEVYEIIINEIYNRIVYNSHDKYGELMKEKVLQNIDEIRIQVERERYYSETLTDLGKPCDLVSLLCDLEEKLHITYNTVSRNAPSIITEIGLSVSEENKNEYATDITEYICFLLGLNLSRKGLYCVSGLGSQSAEYLIHKKIAEWVLKKCDEQVKEYQDQNPETEKSDDCILAETLFNPRR